MQYDVEQMAAMNTAIRALMAAQKTGDKTALAQARKRLRDMQS